MIRFQIIILFMTFVICSFCGKDFVSIGRHSWRCKEKVTNPNSNHRNVNDFEQTLLTVNQNITTGNYSLIKCNCGKKCKGLRGLKAHQRSCRVIEKLNGDLYDVIDEEEENNIPDGEHTTLDATPDIRPGIKLPRTQSQWTEANLFFLSALRVDELSGENIDTAIKKMYDVIYNYLKDNYGCIDKSDEIISEYRSKYKDFTNNQLKNKLKHLKKSNSSICEIQYVSKLLREKIKTASEKIPKTTIR